MSDKTEMNSDDSYRYIQQPLGETPYLIYGGDNHVHYGRDLGDKAIQDARLCQGYYIVHGGSHCRRQVYVARYGNGTYEGRAFCLLPRGNQEARKESELNIKRERYTKKVSSLRLARSYRMMF